MRKLAIIGAVFVLLAFGAYGVSLSSATCVFLGDSITLGVREGVSEHQRFSHLVARRKGCKEVNAGVSSDTTVGMLDRFDRDVKSHSPDWLFIMTENDYWPGSQIPLVQSEGNLRRLIRQGEALGATVVLLTPPSVGDSCAPSIPAESCKRLVTQRELQPDYVAMQRRVAAEMRIKLVDVHREMGESGKYLGDPWHPNAAGQKFIADLID